MKLLYPAIFLVIMSSSNQLPQWVETHGYPVNTTKLRQGGKPPCTNRIEGFEPPCTNRIEGFEPPCTNRIEGFEPPCTNRIEGFKPPCTNRIDGFRLGSDVLLENFPDSLKNKRLALVINQTSILSDGSYLLDKLIEKKLQVVRIFSPEHGIRGDETYSDIDPKTGTPIVSIYGSKFKPAPEDLADVDVIIYDIQDVGARFYTYTSTLYYIAEAAIENSKQLIVCDRPIMINPDYVDGFVLAPAYKSFVGMIPAPVCYGMTSGELASFLSVETGLRPVSTIHVSRMTGYTRSGDYESLNLKWVKPSPNIVSRTSALCYPATCFLEGTNVSEGRGTPAPFELFGAPWCDAGKLAAELNSYDLPGVQFEAATFIPIEKISTYPPKFFEKECYGVKIVVTNINEFEPVKAGMAILVSLKKLFPQFAFNKNNFIDKLAGTDRLRTMINNGTRYAEIVESWSSDLEKFKEERKKYLLY
jgi:uncharacterized protein YbbC (DUF1343 family)